MAKIKIGMGQMLVEGGEPERNFGRVAEMVEEAAELRCDILLLPEALDLAWTHPSSKNEALPIPGPYSDRICAHAKKTGMYICAGLTENSGEAVYNTAILADPQGEIILKYRKINVLVVGQEYYAIGDRLGVVATPFGLIGVNICADNYHDSLDIGYVLGRMGAQIILSPSSWTVDYSVTECNNPYGEKWFKPFHSIASMFDLAIVSTTSVGVIVGGPYEGKKMAGCSLAVNAEGIIMEGPYNEFAGELCTAEFEVPPPHLKGTAIGEMLIKKRGLIIP